MLEEELMQPMQVGGVGGKAMWAVNGERERRGADNVGP